MVHRKCKFQKSGVKARLFLLSYFCYAGGINIKIINMIQRAAVIVIKNGKILLMYRRKPKGEYYVIPGGHIEDGEKPEEAAIRELKEETNIDAETDFLFLENENDGWHNYFFMAKNVKGEARFGGEELERNSAENHYELKWIELSKIPEINLLPTELKEKLIETFNKRDSKSIAYCDL